MAESSGQSHFAQLSPRKNDSRQRRLEPLHYARLLHPKGRFESFGNLLVGESAGTTEVEHSLQRIDLVERTPAGELLVDCVTHVTGR